MILILFIIIVIVILDIDHATLFPSEAPLTLRLTCLHIIRRNALISLLLRLFGFSLFICDGVLVIVAEEIEIELFVEVVDSVIWEVAGPPAEFKKESGVGCILKTVQLLVVGEYLVEWLGGLEAT